IDRGRGRDLRFGAQPSPARQGTGDTTASPAQADQAPARTSGTRADARRVVAQARRRQEGGRRGLWPAEDPQAEEGSAGHAANLPFLDRPQEAPRRAAARGRLSPALQHQRRRPQPSLAALFATGRNRAGVQGTEERSFGSANPSPTRNPHRSPYFRGVP